MVHQLLISGIVGGMSMVRSSNGAIKGYLTEKDL